MGDRVAGGDGDDGPGAVQYRYDDDKTVLVDFLQEFHQLVEESFEGNVENASEEALDRMLEDTLEGEGAGAGGGQVRRAYKYRDMLQAVANKDIVTVVIEMDDLASFRSSTGESGLALVEKIEENTMRYVDIAQQAIDLVMPAPSHSFLEHVEEDKKKFGDSTASMLGKDPVDIVVEQRRERIAREQQSDEGANLRFAAEAEEGREAAAVMERQREQTMSLPSSLQRKYEVVFQTRTSAELLDLRRVRAQHIGKLIKLKGIVTRSSAVKPLIVVATYNCQACGFWVFQEVAARQYMPLHDCPSGACCPADEHGRPHQSSKGTLELLTRMSKFVKFQEIKIQELPDQVPIGHTPRSMTVYAVGEMTRIATAGDIVTISGVFLPTPFAGWQALRAGLIADTYLQAMTVAKKKKSYAQYELDENSLLRVQELSEDPRLYERLAFSIAPEIYGHEDVKKALLLLMVGGVTREMPDGMKIRGDINVCLMGDPGVAKSQLLKHIASIAPRGVYTSGKGASGVGLTAAVVRDPTTNEFVLEGGSLVLADMGICCIDEFDKMDESDRTAIHEVMEQQTISIAKAGINTTLNARTAVLAAANPAYGRYNVRRSPAENINLPAALLSRFDLMFLILDKPNYEKDLALAQHITYVHMHNEQPEQEFEPLDTEFMRTYIAQARTLAPFVPKELTQYVVGAYVNIRQSEVNEPHRHTYTTARSLLAILRLAQALARLAFRDQVTREDVDEAIRLIDCSKVSLFEEQQKQQNSSRNDDVLGSIYEIIRALALQRSELSLPYSAILPRILAPGYTQEQLDECLDKYERYDVWTVAADRSTVTVL